MRKVYILSLLLIAMASGYFVFFRDDTSSREDYETFLNEHPYSKILHERAEENESEEDKEAENPGMALMQNFLMTMDPEQHRPTPEVLMNQNEITSVMRDSESSREMETATSLSTATVWTERGPKQEGGRTRALMFDPNDPNKRKVWAAGVAGGLWVNSNITDAASPWQKVNDFWDNLAISCIAADPVNAQVFYVGTGEGWFNIDSVVGAGIWKTTDGGATWNLLSTTSTFSFVNDIVVRNESNNGVVYAAVQNGVLSSNNGLFRSDNGGSSWTQVLPSTVNQQSVTDIEIAAGGKLFVGAKPKSSGQSTIYQSTNGTTWTTPTSFTFNGRVEIACAPSNELVAYAIFVNSNKVGGIVKTIDGGATWNAISVPTDADLGIPSNDFSREQAWYDLILSVQPNNANTCLVGSIDLFATTNGGTSWSQISKWSNNANLNTLTCALVHADQHNIVFRPGFPNEVIVGNDGGVYYSSNITSAATTNAFSSRNLNYNVTQFYSAAIHPTTVNFMLGGTQDNGTEKFTLTGFDNSIGVMGGDGGMCFIDQINPSFQIGSFTNNNFRLSTDGGVNFSTVLIDDDATGNFINQGDYDSNLKILYTGKSTTELYRVRNVTTTRNLESVAVNLGTDASAFRVSPYTTTSSTLLVGTEAGRLFRILNANTASTTISEITGPAFPNGTISSISFGASENQILVTFSNYGVASVWETRNGGTTWTNREGNLPNMPVRWGEYHPQNFDQVFLATELGVWSSDNINIASPAWNSTNGGLANVRTDMIRIRKSDGLIMAATHGRGVFTGLVPSSLDQTITFSTIASSKTFGDPAFKLSAKSTSGLPVTFSSSNPAVASVTDSTVTITGAGAVSFTANQIGNVYYQAAPPVIQAITINKAQQTITFAQLPEKDEDDPDFTISATASSGLPVSFSSTNLTVASVAGNTLVINGAGTASITAQQSGNSNYLPATNVVQSFTVLTRIIELAGNLNFEEAYIGESPKKTILIKNNGTGSLNVTNVLYPAGYKGETKTVGSNIELTVTFTPTAVLEYNGEVVVQSNATSGVSRMAVSGAGILITAKEKTPEGGIEVYPNPAKDIIMVRSDGALPESITIVDISGREWKLNRTGMAEQVANFDISALAAGTYIIKIQGSKGQIHKQIKKL